MNSQKILLEVEVYYDSPEMECMSVDERYQRAYELLLAEHILAGKKVDGFRLIPADHFLVTDDDVAEKVKGTSQDGVASNHVIEMMEQYKDSIIKEWIDTTVEEHDYRDCEKCEKVHPRDVLHSTADGYICEECIPAEPDPDIAYDRAIDLRMERGEL